MAPTPREPLHRLTFTGPEVRVLYALAGRDIAECVLDTVDGAIAGSHAEHRAAAYAVRAKLSEAVLAAAEASETRPAVRPGQIWQAWSTAYVQGRSVQVESVDERYAYCRVVTPNQSSWGPDTTGRHTRILHDGGPRLRGYRLIQDAP